MVNNLYQLFGLASSYMAAAADIACSLSLGLSFGKRDHVRHEVFNPGLDFF